MKGFNIKAGFLAVLSLLGSALSGLLGGWDLILQSLLLFMLIDYITGLMVAGIFRKSRKTESGAIQSFVGWMGLCKKGVTLLIVVVGARLDLLMGVEFVRVGIIFAFITNELVSIVENMGLMGVKLPSALEKALDMLQSRGEEDEVS